MRKRARDHPTRDRAHRKPHDAVYQLFKDPTLSPIFEVFSAGQVLSSESLICLGPFRLGNSSESHGLVDGPHGSIHLDHLNQLRFCEHAGDVLFTIRAWRGLTQEKLASVMCTHQTWLSRIECDRASRDMKLSTLDGLRIAYEELGMPLFDYEVIALISRTRRPNLRQAA